MDQALKSIICLTEESVETLYLLGKEHLIKGISAFVERPKIAKNLPVVTSFIKSDYKKINDIKPDLVIGFSDIQKDIARDLIGLGHNVWISNQRSLEDILQYIYQLSLIVDAKEKGMALIKEFKSLIDKAKLKGSTRKYKPKIYFEEWDDPQISAIKWVNEVIEICGGENIFKEQSNEAMAMKRVITNEEVIKRNPDIIIACWCGKKVDLNSIKKRDGFSDIAAVKNNHVFEVEPEIFLQPGPALMIDGLNKMLEIFNTCKY